MPRRRLRLDAGTAAPDGAGRRIAGTARHDARQRPDGTLTLFDNHDTPKVGPRPRALTLSLDATATKVIEHPDGVLAIAQGNSPRCCRAGIRSSAAAAVGACPSSTRTAAAVRHRLPGRHRQYRGYRFR